MFILRMTCLRRKFYTYLFSENSGKYCIIFIAISVWSSRSHAYTLNKPSSKILLLLKNKSLLCFSEMYVKN